MKVSASIYDLASGGTNSFLSSILTVGGIYHVGIEVAGIEWSYGYCESGSGVFAVQPTKCTLGPFREQQVLGETNLRADEIIRVLHKLRMDWVGPDYNVMNRNCVFFSKAFIRELNPKLQVPEYCRSLAERAAKLSPASGLTKLRSVPEVFGSPEKEKMWREAERLMREFERDETVDSSSIAGILHAAQPTPPNHTPFQTRAICSKSLYEIRYRNYSAYMKHAQIRRLMLNYR